MIDSFRGQHAFLSNFYEEPDGTTVEHEFQAAKTLDLREKVEVLSAKRPGDAKRLGKRITLRRDWEDVKINEMRSLVLRKFWDHHDLARWLLDTSEHVLVEGNTWHDNFWGVCHCENCRLLRLAGDAPDAQNHLGLILVEVRTLIKNF